MFAVYRKFDTYSFVCHCCTFWAVAFCPGGCRTNALENESPSPSPSPSLSASDRKDVITMVESSNSGFVEAARNAVRTLGIVNLAIITLRIRIQSEVFAIMQAARSGSVSPDLCGKTSLGGSAAESRDGVGAGAVDGAGRKRSGIALVKLMTERPGSPTQVIGCVQQSEEGRVQPSSDTGGLMMGSKGTGDDVDHGTLGSSSKEIWERGEHHAVSLMISNEALVELRDVIKQRHLDFLELKQLHGSLRDGLAKILTAKMESGELSHPRGAKERKSEFEAIDEEWRTCVKEKWHALEELGNQLCSISADICKYSNFEMSDCDVKLVVDELQKLVQDEKEAIAAILEERGTACCWQSHSGVLAGGSLREEEKDFGPMEMSKQEPKEHRSAEEGLTIVPLSGHLVYSLVKHLHRHLTSLESLVLKSHKVSQRQLDCLYEREEAVQQQWEQAVTWRKARNLEEDIAKQMEHLRREKGETETLVAEQKMEVLRLASMLETAREELGRRQLELDELEKRISESQDVLTQCRIESEEKSLKKVELELEIEKRQAEADSFLSRSERLEAELHLLEEHVGRYAADSERARMEKAELDRLKLSLASEIAELMEKRDTLVSELRHLENAVGEAADMLKAEEQALAQRAGHLREMEERCAEMGAMMDKKEQLIHEVASLKRELEELAQRRWEEGEAAVTCESDRLHQLEEDWKSLKSGIENDWGTFDLLKCNAKMAVDVMKSEWSGCVGKVMKILEWEVVNLDQTHNRESLDNDSMDKVELGEGLREQIEELRRVFVAMHLQLLKHRRQCKEQERALRVAQAGLESAEGKREEVEKELALAEAKLHSVEDEVEGLEEKKEVLLMELTSAEDKLSSLAEEIEAAKRNINGSRIECMEMEGEKERLSKEARALEELLMKKEESLRRSEARVGDLRRAMDNLREEMDKMTTEKEETIEDLKRAEGDLGRKREDVAMMEARAAFLSEQIRTSEGLAEGLRREIRALESREEETSTRVKAVELELSVVSGKLSEARSVLRETEENLTRRREELEVLEPQMRQREGEKMLTEVQSQIGLAMEMRERLKAELEAAELEVDSLLREKAEMERELKQVKEALGAERNVLAEAQGQARRQVRENGHVESKLLEADVEMTKLAKERTALENIRSQLEERFVTLLRREKQLRSLELAISWDWGSASQIGIPNKRGVPPQRDTHNDDENVAAEEGERSPGGGGNQHHVVCQSHPYTCAANSKGEKIAISGFEGDGRSELGKSSRGPPKGDGLTSTEEAQAERDAALVNELVAELREVVKEWKGATQAAEREMEELKEFKVGLIEEVAEMRNECLRWIAHARERLRELRKLVNARQASGAEDTRTRKELKRVKTELIELKKAWEKQVVWNKEMTDKGKKYQDEAERYERLAELRRKEAERLRSEVEKQEGRVHRARQTIAAIRKELMMVKEMKASFYTEQEGTRDMHSHREVGDANGCAASRNGVFKGKAGFLWSELEAHGRAAAVGRGRGGDANGVLGLGSPYAVGSSGRDPELAANMEEQSSGGPKDESGNHQNLLRQHEHANGKMEVRMRGRGAEEKVEVGNRAVGDERENADRKLQQVQAEIGKVIFQLKDLQDKLMTTVEWRNHALEWGAGGEEAATGMRSEEAMMGAEGDDDLARQMMKRHEYRHPNELHAQHLDREIGNGGLATNGGESRPPASSTTMLGGLEKESAAAVMALSTVLDGMKQAHLQVIAARGIMQGRDRCTLGNYGHGGRQRDELTVQVQG
ncbi:hypothetical protein CBR_g23770 [Chara braunii]|uniref:Uncharacterized protein n=1 Tax=Chara braunii TaxID=69332 RepID=A0A388JVR6_CHABU|nr:hypothetical protein CBR_g23770 [Chara braunii]|eukprot:GBG61812.1 hypothetical protein CBR_g23770 [Chara braunii]